MGMRILVGAIAAAMLVAAAGASVRGGIEAWQKGDFAAAVAAWQPLAAKGDADAATTLGILLFQNGNRTGGMRWLRKSAEAGEARAMLLYGTALYNGDGVASDPVTAYAFVSRAAAQGLGPAKATLADLDEAMPIEDRRKGVALAQAMVAGKTATTAPVKTVEKPAPAKPAAM